MGKVPDRMTSFHPCSLNVLIGETLQECGESIRSSGIMAVRDLDPALPDVLVNAEQLRQVFLAIVSTAIRSLQGASPEAGRRITVATRMREGVAVCTVSDTGLGEPPLEGPNPGFMVCLGIVKAHGGDIEVKRVKGRGAEYSVILPAIKPAELRPGQAMPDAPSLSGKRILVVEDEDSIREFISSFLGGYGSAVDSARDGREAIEFLRKGPPPDLILSDFRMPDMDGQGLYEWVESNVPALLTRIIYITGDGLNPITRSFLSKTGVPYILKPVAASALVRTVWPMLTGP